MSFFSFLSRIMGWNPIGETIEIQIDEADKAYKDLVGKTIKASIESIEEDASKVKLKLISPIQSGEVNQFLIAATQRHTGCDVYSLKFRPIAIGLEFLNQLAGDVDSRFAIGLMKLSE